MEGLCKVTKNKNEVNSKFKDTLTRLSGIMIHNISIIDSKQNRRGQ